MAELRSRKLKDFPSTFLVSCIQYSDSWIWHELDTFSRRSQSLDNFTTMNHALRVHGTIILRSTIVNLQEFKCEAPARSKNVEKTFRYDLWIKYSRVVTIHGHWFESQSIENRKKSQCDKSCLMVVFHAQFFVDIWVWGETWKNANLISVISTGFKKFF